MPAPDGYSVSEIAHRYHISDKTVRRMIARGDLPAYRLGSRLIRIKADDAERILRPIPTGGAA